MLLMMLNNVNTDVVNADVVDNDVDLSLLY